MNTPVHDAERERLKSKNFIQTFAGKAATPLDLKPEQVCIGDIAHSLALKNRYTGHTRVPYSVAEHSWRASMLVPPSFQLAALLHDASEAYLPDLAAPIKSKFFVELFQAGRLRFAYLEAMTLDAIFVALGIPDLRNLPESETVKKADLQMLAWEARDLIYYSANLGDPTPEDWGLTEQPPYAATLVPMDWKIAEAAFLARYEFLTGGKK